MGALPFLTAVLACLLGEHVYHFRAIGVVGAPLTLLIAVVVTAEVAVAVVFVLVIPVVVVIVVPVSKINN